MHFTMETEQEDDGRCWTQWGASYQAIRKGRSMLNIQIDNPELEGCIVERYGGDMDSLARAFSDFLHHERVKQDIGVSIAQLDAGGGVPLTTAMREIRAKYE